jgi:type II secretory pathway pseudopilin PulG
MINNSQQTGVQGYALLDVALALTIFAFSITSLVVLLQRTVDTSASFARDRLIQSAIDSYMTETKRKPVREMNGEYFDEALGITFRAEVEDLELANADGGGLKDLYKLTVTAEFEDDGGTQEEVAELFIYQPEKR